MGSGVVIVCERTGRWAAALRRDAAGAPRILETRILETRTLDDCRAELRLHPQALVVCEVTENNLPRVLRLLVELQATSPATRAMIVGARTLERHEALLREAGAVHALFSPRSMRAAGDMLRRQAAGASSEPESLETLAWSRLPWGD
jgi:hypothetical protein